MSRTQILAIISGVVLLILVLELVRRRRLREEYSWIWLLTAIGYLAIAAVPGLIERGAIIIGSVRPTSVFTFLGLFFLFLVSIQFSVQISRLAEQNKDLAQQIAILDSEIRRLSRMQDEGTSTSFGQPRGAAPTEGGSDTAATPVTGDSEDNAQRADN
jgi:hypothetical protein